MICIAFALFPGLTKGIDRGACRSRGRELCPVAPRNGNSRGMPPSLVSCVFWTRRPLRRPMKTTEYFDAIRLRADRRLIRDEWIERVIRQPTREEAQHDGRIRRWAPIPEMNNRVLRVILLPDGETVHNAFFDRRFVP